MDQNIIYALDFDGVICDSAVETGITGWKSAAQIWDDITNPLPTPQLIDQFRLVRPSLETGYEAILIIRMLVDGDSVDNILDNYPAKINSNIEQHKLNVTDLKQLFGTTRDQWINQNLNDWVNMNPLFPSISEKLQVLSQGMWYIITTKQERFVKQILNANQIQIADERVFGLDRNMNKEAVLQNLLNKHASSTIYFVEDRLPTLKNILKNQQLSSIKLFFALWGYNSYKDKIAAKHLAIESININNFLSNND